MASQVLRLAAPPVLRQLPIHESKKLLSGAKRVPLLPPPKESTYELKKMAEKICIAGRDRMKNGEFEKAQRLFQEAFKYDHNLEYLDLARLAETKKVCPCAAASSNRSGYESD